MPDIFLLVISPASWADRKVSGGLGIMLDDVLAALYGLAAIAAFRYWY